MIPRPILGEDKENFGTSNKVRAENFLISGPDRGGRGPKKNIVSDLAVRVSLVDTIFFE